MRKFLFFYITTALFISAVPSISQAESYGSFYLGAAIPHETTVADNVGAGGASGRMEFNAGPTAGMKLGYWFSEHGAPYFGLEGDLNMHFPDTDELEADAGAKASMDADTRVYSAMLNGLLRYPGGSFRPYIGFGGGWLFLEVDNGTVGSPIFSITGPSFEGDADGSLGWQFLAGFNFAMTPRMSIFAEYKYARADFELEKGVGLDMDYVASQVYGGITYTFGRKR